MPSVLQLGAPYMSLTFAILAKGRCFFGPSAKGLCSCRSLNLSNTKKQINNARATVGGLPLLKVLKNLTNMFFSITKTVTGGFGFEMKVCVI
jgi:hypothetical protein